MRRYLIVFILFTLTSCGQKALDTATKINNSSIINGTVVRNGARIASSIVGIYNTSYNSICTGTLIADNIVLTAAHCMPEKASHVKIVFSNNIDQTINAREQDILKEYVLPATDFKVSDAWDPNDETTEHNTGDIALIKFRGVIPKGFSAAKIATDDTNIKKGTKIAIAGFGVDYADASEEVNPKKYKNMDKAILEGEIICGDKVKGNYVNCYKVEKTGDGILRESNAPLKFFIETEFHLNETQSGTCNGDSGGPAFIKIEGEYLLLGVTSRGSELCDEIGVYTNAVYYKDWIVSTIDLLK